MDITFWNRTEFLDWFDHLDLTDQRRITRLIDALAMAHAPLTPPHGKHLGEGLHELRSFSGRRVYYKANGAAAGNKDTQKRDIRRARNRS